VYGRTGPRFGVDAPYVIATLGAAAVVAVVVGAASAAERVPALVAAASLAATAAWMLASSLAGKPRAIRRLVSGLVLRGDERVLDVGCGRGLLLVEAARRLDSGRAIGVDVWRGADQSGNRREATERNLAAAGVADRAEVVDGDARQLPFDDASFDVVVSSLVIHNISDKKERERALGEIRRVLKPGGRFAVIDIQYDYAPWLTANGFVIEETWMNLLFALPTRAMAARKASSEPTTAPLS
jgi:ubiquinone/menaquinone biosynthesis C-methylase UbiE